MTKMDPNVKIAIGRLVADLVAGNYGQVVHDGRSGRLSEGGDSQSDIGLRKDPDAPSQ